MNQSRIYFLFLKLAWNCLLTVWQFDFNFWLPLSNSRAEKERFCRDIPRQITRTEKSKELEEVNMKRTLASASVCACTQALLDSGVHQWRVESQLCNVMLQQRQKGESKWSEATERCSECYVSKSCSLGERNRREEGIECERRERVGQQPMHCSRRTNVTISCRAFPTVSCFTLQYCATCCCSVQNTSDLFEAIASMENTLHTHIRLWLEQVFAAILRVQRTFEWKVQYSYYEFCSQSAI